MTTEKNNYLQDKIMYNGFGVSPEKIEDLYSNLNKGEEKTLPNEKTIGEDKYVFMLKFRKGENDLVYLNGFTAIDKENDQKQQYFALGKDKLNITSKEAYNLMEGRSVFKNLQKDENTKNPVWLKLDFSKKNENGNFKIMTFNKSYGFFPEKQIAKMGVDLQYKKDLMKSLKKGNEVKATIELKGETKIVNLVSNPEKKKVNFTLVLDKDNVKDVTMASNINNFTVNYLVSNPKKQESFIGDLNIKDANKLLTLSNGRTLEAGKNQENVWESTQLSSIIKLCSNLLEKDIDKSKKAGVEK